MGSPVMKSDKVRETLSRNVRAMCAELQISENELAKRSGVSQKQVNNIVHCRTGAGVDSVDYLARVLGVSAWMMLLPELPDIIESCQRTQRVVSDYLTLRAADREAVDHLIGTIVRRQ